MSSIAAWLSRNLSWSNSRQSWMERLAALLLLAGAIGLGWFGRRLPLAQQFVLWGILAVGLALVLRRGWLKLFGPVFFYDLVRTSRRGRYILIRTGYALLLILILLVVYSSWSISLVRGGRIPIRRMPEFAESFFFPFMLMQFGAVLLLTPGYVAGAIAEEKDRRTLEYLLATDLQSREIVFGKLASRLANLTLVILTGLPILSLLELLGGVDPNLVLAGFAATGLTAFSLAALSILNSVLLRRPRDAILLTYLEAAGYLVLSGLSTMLLPPSGGLATMALTWGAQPITVADAVEWFSSGNIITACGSLFAGMSSGKRVDVLLPALLRNYAIFHGSVALICTMWAVARLRRVALQQGHGQTRKMSRKITLIKRPRVGLAPMRWKELFVEPSFRFNWPGRLLMALIVIVSFYPVPFLVADYFNAPLILKLGGNIESPSVALLRLGEEMNIWVRIAGTAVACLMLLAVAVHAAGSISSERDRRTWDSLLVTPLHSDTILSAKWLGSIMSVRWAWCWLGLIWGLGMFTGGLHPLAVLLLLIAWGIYAAFVASIGLWFSMVARTSLRALIYTLLTVAGVGFGHWLVWMCCLPIIINYAPKGDTYFTDLAKFQAAGLTPPVTLGVMAFRVFESPDREAEWWVPALVGLCIFGSAVVYMFIITKDRLRRITCRVRYHPKRHDLPTVAPAEEKAHDAEAGGQLKDRSAQEDGTEHKSVSK